MKSVFDYARDKIEKEYIAKNDNEKSLKRYYLLDIDYYEKESKHGIKNAISCRWSAFWRAQSDNEKFFIGGNAVVIAFILLVFLYGLKDTPLNILILNASKSFFFCFVVLGIAFLYSLFRQNTCNKRFYCIALSLFFVLSIPHIPVLCGYETTQIGDFYEAREYTEKYYVIMSRDPEGTPNRKQYTLPAEIERRLDYGGTTEVYEDYYSQEHGGYDIYTLQYHINYLYFPNGGYLTFDYDEAYENPEYSTVYVDNETDVVDYHGDEYYITLTTRKAKN